MSVDALKWLQFIQTVLVFILPALIVALIAGKKHPIHWWHLDVRPDWRKALCWMGLVLLASPGVNLLSELNQGMHLPSAWADLEQNLRSMEDSAAEVTMLFLMPNHWHDLIVNLCLMAILPAFAEELTFRGTMVRWNTHLCVWIVAAIFSAVHMQFFGFFPRMLLGAWFGYVFIWTGCLWIPMLMHATNNALAVFCYDYAFRHGMDIENMSAFGAGDTWYVGVLSLILTIVGIFFLRRYSFDKH